MISTGRRSKKAGLPPGTLIHIGRARPERAKIRVLDYDEHQLVELKDARVEDLERFKDSRTVTWIDVVGVHDIDAVDSVGQTFGLHPLSLEDIVATDQRPKLHEYEDYLLLVMRILSPGGGGRIHEEQVSIVLGRRFVISFREGGDSVFDPVADRIRNSKGRVRKMGADYLAYALIDAVVDSYFLLLDDLTDRLERVEQQLFERPSVKLLRRIIKCKRDLSALRKAVWPLREALMSIQREELSLITREIAVYIRDVYDHAVHVLETAESLRENVSGNLEIYLSVTSNRMNEIVKVLTVISTIFIPLTFITGIYGMNFRYMPELSLRYGYYAVLFGMLVIGLVMVAYFRKKRWI